MDLTYEYLWSAGYLLPTDTPLKGGIITTVKEDGSWAVHPNVVAVEVPRRGKKAARAKRGRAKS